MMHELIGSDVLITDIAGPIPRTMGVYTIKEVKEDTELIFADGDSHAYVANDEEFKKLQNGEVAWVHPNEVTIEILVY